MISDRQTIFPGPRPAARRGAVLGAVLLVAALAGVTGCEDSNTVSPPPCANFAAAEDPAAGAVTALKGDASTCEVVEVELVVTDVNDVFGFNTTVQYGVAASTYIGFSAVGSVLGSDGATVVPVIQETSSGVIELGMDRISDSGIDVSGTGLLVKLYFAPASSGSGEMTLGSDCLWGVGDPPTPLPGVTCSGGTLISQ